MSMFDMMFDMVGVGNHVISCVCINGEGDQYKLVYKCATCDEEVSVPVASSDEFNSKEMRLKKKWVYGQFIATKCDPDLIYSENVPQDMMSIGYNGEFE